MVGSNGLGTIHCQLSTIHYQLNSLSTINYQLSTNLMPNRLAAESSPYLRQHQFNPVDWYAWGSEAFEAAREKQRPIFLSVGYSTCYWCHVMERQCFENPAIAEEMNQRFISIKVDREERPDVDQLYMMAVQMLTRQGGWPMSVFLIPDLRPFYGGTYFPPTDQYGRPGFPTLLQALDNAWQTRVGDVIATGDQLLGVFRRLAEPPALDAAMSIDEAFIAGLIDRSISDYDRTHGGFGGAPKFPRQTLLELLLTYTAPKERTLPRAEKVRAMVLHTLDSLSRGGIRDHLGGGFHRYSTDAEWLVPHFEIMLYDNAMLAWCYVEAFRQTRDREWAARGVRNSRFRSPRDDFAARAFYTAFDAEVDAMEGASYLWTREEVLQLLQQNTPTIAGDARIDEAEVFCLAYGLDEGPNFADPHHGNGTPDKNILYLPRPLDDVAADLKIVPDLLFDTLAKSRQTLLAARGERKQPSLDTKILTSCNALMVRRLLTGEWCWDGRSTPQPRSARPPFYWCNMRLPTAAFSAPVGGFPPRPQPRPFPCFLKRAPGRLSLPRVLRAPILRNGPGVKHPWAFRGNTPMPSGARTRAPVGTDVRNTRGGRHSTRSVPPPDSRLPRRLCFSCTGAARTRREMDATGEPDHRSDVGAFW